MTEATSPMGSDHRAFVWRGLAEPMALSLETIPLPVPTAGEVLVRNEVIGLNPVDWKVLGNSNLGWTSGHVPGVDGAGIVVAVGPDVSSDMIGRRVAYHQDLHRNGSFAEHTAVAAKALLRLPDELSFETAASFPCPALTAWLAIEKVPIAAGQHVLISGAGGAVGNYLVQLAAARDFVVTAMANPRHFARLAALGADRCLPGPMPADAEWPDAERRRFFAAFDSVGPEHAARLVPLLAANGHIVCIQGRLANWTTSAFGLCPSLHEVALGGTMHGYADEEQWAALTEAGEAMLRSIVAGALKPEAQILADFADLPLCLDKLRHRTFSGKPLIRIAKP